MLSARQYAEKWPNYCKTCFGHGSFVQYEDHGMGIGYEELWEPCATCIVWAFCPRCGENQYEEWWMHWVILVEYTFEQIYIYILNAPKSPRWLRKAFGLVGRLGSWFGKFIPDKDMSFFEDILHVCIHCKWSDGTPGMPEGPDPEEVDF